MNEVLKKAIADLAKEASENGKIFVFCYEPRTPEKAKEIMMAYADGDIEKNYGGDQTAYLKAMRECMTEKKENIVSLDNGTNWKSVAELTDEEISRVLEDIDHVGSIEDMDYTSDIKPVSDVTNALSGLYDTDREWLEAFLVNFDGEWVIE